MAEPLRLAVWVAAAWATGGLAGTWLRAHAYGKRVLLAPPAGDPSAGIRYAFTAAMLPQAKESVRLHLPSYVLGVIFHLGTFAAFALLAARLGKLQLPTTLLSLAAAVTFAGAGAGLGLLVKRIANPHLRGLSSPDDYVANLTTTAFAALAGAAALFPPVNPAWFGAAVLLLVYLPVGKLRHCVFFFLSRAHLGAFLGFRGTFPPAREP